MSAEDRFDSLTDFIRKEPGFELALKVLRHHRPRGNGHDVPRCEGCDNSGDMNPNWPCSTTRLIAVAIGRGSLIGLA